MPESATNATHEWRERRSIVLMLEGDDGLIGFGEASPLPGISPDTADEAKAELEAYAADKTPPTKSPSARFALETALLDLQAQREDVPLWQLFADATQSEHSSPAAYEAPLACNALVMGSPDTWHDEARELAARGFRTIKLKIGKDFDAELTTLVELAERGPANVRFRVDANGVLTLKQAEKLRGTLSPTRFEYIEDPVAVKSSSKLAAEGLPVALDAFVTSPETFAQAAKLAAVRALAIKPTCFGSITALLATAAETPQIELALSHAFEGPIAWAASVHLALALPKVTACGLARHGVLSAWPSVLPELDAAPAARLPRPVCAGLGIKAPALRRWLDG